MWGGWTIYHISTIHSFAWKLISNFQSDIRAWLRANLVAEIAGLQQEQSKGRPNTKATLDRQKKIESKSRRLEGLDGIHKFTYNPNGDNRTRDSLNHAEVIKISADFLIEKRMMRNILTNAFPILLVDESQDTNKLLMEAFFEVQKTSAGHFSLGLFGDVMQRIYADGKPDLGVSLPDDWAKPAKRTNHRSAKRIIKLINKIRSVVDQQQQTPVSNQQEGTVRMFIVPSDRSDKAEIESGILERMATLTGDEGWNEAAANLKILILEHRMAASRMGFSELFEPLYSVDRLTTGLLDGTLAGLRFFSQLILPLIQARRAGDEFSIARVVREFSPLLKNELLRKSSNQLQSLRDVQNIVNKLLSLWDGDRDPGLLEIFYLVYESGLFQIPDSLLPIALRDQAERQQVASMKEGDEEEDGDETLDAWDKALKARFSQLERYNEYISNRARFGTHQGVKGLEFPRVVVIVDDSEARGFLFKYDKLFGSEAMTKTDLQNVAEGRETSIDRTRRLFYVTCSRAKNSLAIVAYTKNPSQVKTFVCSEGWFEENEVVLVQ